jgi:hypothetical protein
MNPEQVPATPAMRDATGGLLDSNGDVCIALQKFDAAPGISAEDEDGMPSMPSMPSMHGMEVGHEYLKNYERLIELVLMRGGYAITMLPCCHADHPTSSSGVVISMEEAKTVKLERVKSQGRSSVLYTIADEGDPTKCIRLRGQSKAVEYLVDTFGCPDDSVKMIVVDLAATDPPTDLPDLAMEWNTKAASAGGRKRTSSQTSHGSDAPSSKVSQSASPPPMSFFDLT